MPFCWALLKRGLLNLDLGLLYENECSSCPAILNCERKHRLFLNHCILDRNHQRELSNKLIVLSQDTQNTVSFDVSTSLPCWNCLCIDIYLNSVREIWNQDSIPSFIYSISAQILQPNRLSQGLKKKQWTTVSQLDILTWPQPWRRVLLQVLATSVWTPLGPLLPINSWLETTMLTKYNTNASTNL